MKLLCFNNKKSRALFLLGTVSILMICLLTGCKKDIVPLSQDDYLLTGESATSKGIQAGSSLEEFLTAYGDYMLFVSENEADYMVMEPEYITTSIPAESNLNILITDYFVDQETLDRDAFCETNQIEKENLLNHLNSEDFLSSHTVVYRYLSFDISNGSVTQVHTDFRDFNAELSYDQERAN